MRKVSDAWSIGKEDRRKPNVMELKCPRRIGRIDEDAYSERIEKL